MNISTLLLFFTKRLNTNTLVFFCLFIISTISYAQNLSFSVKAKSWLLVDVTANQILAFHNIQKSVEPASLTKLMTAYLVFNALKTKKILFDQIVTITDSIKRVKKDESRMFIQPHELVSVNNLLHGMLTQSGNDAAITLAELVGGNESKFVEMMNEKAKQLGMIHTHFVDVNGMPHPNHFTTAEDLARLVMHLMKDFQDYYKIFSEHEFTYNNIRQINRNRLLWLDSSVDGLKTGHTASAGYCLIASAKRLVPTNLTQTNRRLVVILMGEPNDLSRVQDSLKLLEYGYKNFDIFYLYKANQVIKLQKIYKAAFVNSVSIGVLSDKYITIQKSINRNIKLFITYNDPLIAPLKKSQPVGTITVINTENNSVLTKFPLYVLENVQEAGILKSFIDSLLLIFYKNISLLKIFLNKYFKYYILI